MENQFQVRPFGGSQHDPEEKITFLTHVPKIISKKEAVNLVANILALLGPEQHKEIDGLLDGSIKPPSSKEFPKMLYHHEKAVTAKSHVRLVNSAEEQEAAEGDGYVEEPHPAYDHGLAQEKEEAENAVNKEKPAVAEA